MGQCKGPHVSKPHWAEPGPKAHGRGPAGLQRTSAQRTAGAACLSSESLRSASLRCSAPERSSRPLWTRRAEGVRVACTPPRPPPPSQGSAPASPLLLNLSVQPDTLVTSATVSVENSPAAPQCCTATPDCRTDPSSSSSQPLSRTKWVKTGESAVFKELRPSLAPEDC